MSVPTEFHSTLCRTYHTLCILVRQPITEVKAEWNVAADVWEIEPNLTLVAFYDMLGIMRTFSHLKPPGSERTEPKYTAGRVNVQCTV